MSVSEIYAATWEQWTWTEFWQCGSKLWQIWVIQPQYVYLETTSHLLWIINSPHCHCVTFFIRNTSFWKKVPTKSFWEANISTGWSEQWALCSKKGISWEQGPWWSEANLIFIITDAELNIASLSFLLCYLFIYLLLSAKYVKHQSIFKLKSLVFSLPVQRFQMFHDSSCTQGHLKKFVLSNQTRGK